MRAREFLPESDGNTRLSNSKRYPTRGLNTFHDGEKWNTDYTLNRVMMAAACTDGTFVPDMDKESWIGKGKTAHPYTKQEQDMLRMAYKAANADWHDLNGGDLDSEEAPGGNPISPIKGFQGYPR